jgi:protein-L-isoaspartate(D-aspartate) O-methyltransferase
MGFEAKRMTMVDSQLRRRDISDEAVLAAFARVPRHDFVPPDLADRAYDDVPLPIGDDQTISQPYIVALTAQALALRGHERVLDIGTGSGYAAAILATLATHVDSVERIESLATSATQRLARLGFANVTVHQGDGSFGWPPGAPYEAIAVAAAAERLPGALLDQLAVGGRLVVPIGTPHGQHLVRVTRESKVVYAETDLGAVRFVPLISAS